MPMVSFYGFPKAKQLKEKREIIWMKHMAVALSVRQVLQLHMRV
jgi:hypothetical protein